MSLLGVEKVFQNRVQSTPAVKAGYGDKVYKGKAQTVKAQGAGKREYEKGKRTAKGARKADRKCAGGAFWGAVQKTYSRPVKKKARQPRPARKRAYNV